MSNDSTRTRTSSESQSSGVEKGNAAPCEICGEPRGDETPCPHCGME